MGGRKRKAAKSGSEQANASFMRAMASSSQQPAPPAAHDQAPPAQQPLTPAIRIQEPPSQQSDSSPFSRLDPFTPQNQVPAAPNPQPPSQRPVKEFMDYGGPLNQQLDAAIANHLGPPPQDTAKAFNNNNPSLKHVSSNEPHGQYLSVPQAHDLAKSQYDRLSHQADPPAEKSDNTENSSDILTQAIASSPGPKNSNPDSLPPVSCCSRLRAPTPFATAKDIKDRFDQNKTRLTEKIRAFDWQMVALRVRGNNLEAMIRGYWKGVQWSLSFPTEEGLKRLEKELEDLKKDFSSARAQCEHYKWELRDNERSREHHMQSHQDHEPHFRHFLKRASTLVPRKRSKGPYKYVIQVTEDLTSHEKEFYMDAMKEQKRREEEEEERREREGRYLTKNETDEYEGMKKQRREEAQRLRLKWKKAELRTRIYAPLPDGNYCYSNAAPTVKPCGPSGFNSATSWIVYGTNGVTSSAYMYQTFQCWARKGKNYLLPTVG